VIPLRDANPTRRTPVVTLSVIAACSAVFAYQFFLGAARSDVSLDAFVTAWAIVPAELVAAIDAGAIVSRETLTLISSQFLHGGFLHLAGNLLFLWIFGNNIEDRFGRPAFLAFYLVGGVVAGLTQVLIDPASTVPIIGASGAIAATLGAYLVLFPRARVTTVIFLVFFYQLIDLPAVFVLAFWFLLQLIDGFGSLGMAGASAGGIAFFAHIGGFVFGAAVGWLVRLTGSGWRPVGRTVG
jgi:membrane associated rhomboid family serine protease